MALLPLFTTACIDETRIVQIYPDGTGTIIERIVLSPEFIERMNNGGKIHPIEKPKLNELREAAPRYGDGVTFSNAVEIETDFGSGYEAYYDFTDVNLIYLDLNSRNKPSGRELTTFSMRPGNPAELVIHWPADDRISVLGIRLHEMFKGRQDAFDTAQRRPAEEQASALNAMLRMLDIRAASYVEIIGEAVETDATYMNGNYITLVRIAYGEVMENDEALSAMTQWERDPNVQETVEFLSQIPNQAIETRSEIYVQFREGPQ